MTTQDYRSYLRDELSARKARNPSYSLRAFARDLGLPADQLSSILHRRYGLSRQRAEAIGSRMGLGSDEAKAFCHMVEAEHGRSQGKRSQAKAALSRMQHEGGRAALDLDAFKTVADWYHFAILELAEMDGGLDQETVSARLGISKGEAKAALSRLLRLQLLEDRSGRLMATSSATFAPPGVTDRSKRRFLSQLAAKAVHALESQPPESREFASDLLAIAAEDLPAIKEAVRCFRRTLTEIALKPGKKTAVYCVNVQCFRIAD